ncbi:hypothetical protein [Mongoliibacter ruber]|uniref:Uncharacterized protein n=1 Tax=Mongoliibacter ruber TaxID=1750599 RepID=A0A2T0WJW4_9BACT|nr:hypothetical protein [Mongoliibacter ruber]PRY87003.1 hypothetical protein CLW00_10771 [Mongoliibacter ruber]
MALYNSKIARRSTYLTTVILSLQLLLLIFPSCYTSPEFEDDLCGSIQRANITEISQVFYSPFTNGSFADENDTVQVADFRYNFELHYERLQSSFNGFPGQCFALDCEPRFEVENISNIQILLLEEFIELAPGTDISYLFQLPDQTQLSRFRDYSQMSQFFTLTFHGSLGQVNRMRTALIVYLKNGEQLRYNSISPFLKN